MQDFSKRTRESPSRIANAQQGSVDVTPRQTDPPDTLD